MSDGGDILIDFAHGLKEVHMMTDTPRASRYALSFTSGALLMREALIAAPIYLREHDWAKVRQLIEEDNLLQARTVSTGHRLAREVAQRLAVLTDDELELLVDATTSERGHLMWAAACRRYDLIGEFAEEVLRERFLLLTPTLDSRRLRQLHPEQGALARGSRRPQGLHLAQASLQCLPHARRGGLLTEDGRILQAVLSARVADALSARTPSDVRFFPTGGGRAMNRVDLTKQEEHLFAVLSGKRFLQMEGLSNEVPFFIYPYAPEDALDVAQAKKRIKNKLARRGINVREVNLYDLSVEILKERGVWERVLARSPSRTRTTSASCSKACSTRSSTSRRRSDPRSRTANSTSSSSPASARSSRTSGRTTCSTTFRAS